MNQTRPVALLVTHGVLGEELVRTVASILGPQSDVATVSNSGFSADGLTNAIEEKVREFPADAPIVLFTDLAAGSCGIASRRLGVEGRIVRKITGVNLPMLLEFFHYRDTLSLDDLLPRLEAKGRAGIIIL
ncbi:MAG: PTS mannose transporter subunit IIAB [Candidatus Eisenbacteria bacterium]|uniref:PTS mannose transporter subunit IIAB n=1 Tax=Eiseniibacteriota bacterium TaxID=2212470 RepID=A0A538TUG8_UNCEI|nr:MAG: PTS mannose transporter subunit IIAB [Candidatus Eisenbacteria bacterium]